MELQVFYGISIGRVSSQKQGLTGDSLEDQEKQVGQAISRVEQMHSCKIVIKEQFDFTESASGDIDLQPLIKAIEYCKNQNNKIKFAFIKSIDRVTRGGSATYGYLKAEFAKTGVTLIDTYGIISSQTVNTLAYLGTQYKWSEYSPSWITELLEAERAKAEVRDILTRMIGAEINYTRLGYKTRQPQMGFINVKIETPHGLRSVMKPHPLESSWFIRMFELREQGNLSDREIVYEINARGFLSRIKRKYDKNDRTKIIGHTGGKPLAVKQLQEYIRNPIYAGINTEKWTGGKAIKMYGGGLVSIEVFNKANRGKVKIIEQQDHPNEVLVIKGQIEEWKLKKNKLNPLYPFKQQILCPKCNKEFYGSATPGKSGERFPAYHCNRGHKRFGVKLKDVHDLVTSFVGNVHFTDKYRKRMEEILLSEWEKRKASIMKDTISLDQQVASIKEQQLMLAGKIKMLTSEVAIRALEEDIDKLELQRVQATVLRDKKDEQQINIQVLINNLKYYMEHLDELILGGTDPLQNGAMFGLLFDKQPTYEELKIGTPKLASIYTIVDKKVSSASSRGFEPPILPLGRACSIQLSYEDRWPHCTIPVLC